jgi:hypothetical protein
MPSLPTVYRVVRSGNTRKIVSWENKQKDPEEQLQYLVDMDGMVQTPQDLLERYGCVLQLFGVRQRIQRSVVTA